MPEITIHTTVTGPMRNGDGYGVMCRCGWASHATTQTIARTLGDAHLLCENAGIASKRCLACGQVPQYGCSATPSGNGKHRL